RLAAVGRVGEHIVDGEQAARRNPWCPTLVVGARGDVGVAAVDEHHAERRPPQPGYLGGPAHHDHDVVLDPGRGQRGAQPWQRVQAAGARVDETWVVVLPAGLVLLRAAVMVHGDDQLARL